MTSKKRIFTLSLIFITISINARDYHFKTIDKRFDSLAKIMDKMDFDNIRDSIKPEWIAKLNKISIRTGNKQLKARTLYWSVRCTQMGAQPQKCIPILEKAKALCDPKYEYDIALINYQLAGNYERIGNYGKAYSLLINTIPKFKRYGDYFFAGNGELLMAQLFIDIDDVENAKSSLIHSKEYYRKAKFPLNRIYFFEAVTSADKNNKMKLFKKSIANGCGNDFYLKIQALANISDIFIKENKLDSAEAYMNKAVKTVNKYMPSNQVFRTLTIISHIKVLYSQRKYKETLELLKEVGKNNKSIQGERFVETIYEYFYKVYEELGNYPQSYKYMKLYLNELMSNEDKIRKQEVPKARAREAIARHNNAIMMLEKDAQLSRGYMYTAILAAVIVLLVAAIFCLYFLQRNRIRKIKNRELQNTLRQESIIYAMNRKNFEQDIKQKECEISSSTLLLANKNEVLRQISNITKLYSEKGKIPQEYVKQINAIIGDSVKNDDNWQRFKLHFDKVHPSFFIKLKSMANGLTENDIRLCAYLRIGMRAKQIAEMLSISPDSVNTNRYRLRKKFGLKRGESLDEFIRNI